MSNLSVSIGIKFVKKASIYVVFKCFNKKGVNDIREYFNTKEEAENRLKIIQS
jgi:hypothetical protein